MVQVVKVVSQGVAYRVPGCQGVGLKGPVGPGGQGGHGVCLQSPRWSTGGPRGSQGVKGYTYKVLGSQGVGLQVTRGSRGWLQGPRGSRGRSSGSQRVKG